MSKLAKALTAAAGNAAGESLYVEDVFSTYLFTGTGTTNNIVNGIDLGGEGGLVWLKNREGADSHGLFDTERGVRDLLRSNTTDASVLLSSGDGLTAFNSDGFTLGDGVIGINTSGIDNASWTFRKAEKFFDVVTYTGDGVAGKTVAHNLGSTPAVMIFKRTDASSGNWPVYVSSLGATALLRLNITNASFTSPDYFNDTAPTDSSFTVGNSSNINASGGSYVAYLFASNAGGFGDDGSESIIKCGSYTGNATERSVTLGWEPQFVIIKNTDNTDDWWMVDNMRGVPTGGEDALLKPNKSEAEGSNADYIDFNSRGFTVKTSYGIANESGSKYIYIAIRRPMKTPESGTEVFDVLERIGTGGNVTVNTSIEPVDLVISKATAAARNVAAIDRMRGQGELLYTNSTAAEIYRATSLTGFDVQDGYTVGADGDNLVINQSGTNYVNWAFKRATGFFDVVAYTGTGVARTVNHNLGVVPELMILKVRNRAGSSWVGYHKDLGNEGGFSLTSSAAFSGVTSAWNSTTPTSSVFTVGTGSNYNGNTDNLIAYLFATLAGVSKVGSYTGTGADLNVDCGFSAGARFILIKRTDSTGDWYVYDSARGIVAGNDPYLLLNSSAAEVTSTDYIDPLSSGFTVTSSAPAALNASGGTYIFMAIS